MLPQKISLISNVWFTIGINDKTVNANNILINKEKISVEDEKSLKEIVKEFS